MDALAGAALGAWLGATGQLLSAAKHNNAPYRFAHCTGSHQNLKSPVEGFAGSACRVPKRMVGWLAQPSAASCRRAVCKTCSECLCSTSHCLPRTPDTAGLPKLFVWEESQSFRAGGYAGWARAARCELYQQPATAGAHTP
eukprot:1046312-Pelagomonas_calceolata.AAC.2